MKDELVPSESTLEATPKYRKDLAGGLLYKVTILFLVYDVLFRLHNYAFLSCVFCMGITNVLVH